MMHLRPAFLLLFLIGALVSCKKYTLKEGHYEGTVSNTLTGKSFHHELYGFLAETGTRTFKFQKKKYQSDTFKVAANGTFDLELSRVPKGVNLSLFFFRKNPTTICATRFQSIDFSTLKELENTTTGIELTPFAPVQFQLDGFNPKQSNSSNWNYEEFSHVEISTQHYQQTLTLTDHKPATLFFDDPCARYEIRYKIYNQLGSITDTVLKLSPLEFQIPNTYPLSP